MVKLFKPRYESKEISKEEAIEIRSNFFWKWIYDTNNGACYWNEITGELLWSTDGKSFNHQNLIRE